MSDKIVGHIWKRMLSIYGHKWSSHLGEASNDTGLLSDAAKTWQQGLSGVTLEQIKHGFDVLIFKNHGWPPSLPEFRNLCRQNAMPDTPSLDEVIAIMVTVRNRNGSLVKRYTHPLALAISQHELVDMHNLRTAKTADAKRMVKPVYEKFIDTGWPGWPDHAHEEQNAIGHNKPGPSKAGALSYLNSIKSGLRQ